MQLLDAPESEVPEIVHVIEVEGKSLCDKIKCTVTIETEEVSPVLIELTVDTAVSILPYHLYKQHSSLSSFMTSTSETGDLLESSTACTRMLICACILWGCSCQY